MYVPGGLYIWKGWQVSDFQLLNWNLCVVIGQPDKVLRNKFSSQNNLFSLLQPCKWPSSHCLQERQHASQLEAFQHLEL